MTISARVAPARAVAVAEAGGWSIFIPSVPVSADAATFPAAVDEMVDALREYAEDWVVRLRLAANHSENWSLVQLVMLSTNEQLRDWLVGA